MNKYRIYCSREQVKKALELGAPINKRYTHYACFSECFFDRPTTEQMIGWLEDQGIWEISIQRMSDGWCFHIYGSWADVIVFKDYTYSSRKEATLAAIDAALEYLMYNKK